MHETNGNEVNSNDEFVYPDEPEAEDEEELAGRTGDYATQMEEVLGLDEEEEEEDGFLYQGEDSQDLSAPYNVQLRSFIDGLEDGETTTAGSVLNEPINEAEARDGTEQLGDEEFVYRPSSVVCYIQLQVYTN